MANFQDLQAEVARYKAVAPQVVALINGIPAKIAQAVAAATAGTGIDQTAFDQLEADLKATTDQIVVVLNAAATAAPAVPPVATA